MRKSKSSPQSANGSEHDERAEAWAKFIGSVQEAAELGAHRAPMVLRWAKDKSSKITIAPGLVAARDPNQNTKDEIELDVWLSNLPLFARDPLDIRAGYFCADGENHHTRTDFHDLMALLWQDAETFLYENPIGKKSYANEKHLSKGDTGFTVELTKAQKNALEIFRSIRGIQSLTMTARPIYKQAGPVQYEPVAFEGGWPDSWYDFSQINNREAFNKLFAEIMLLTRAVMNLDFHGFLWSHIQRGAIQKLVLNDNAEFYQAMREYSHRLWPALYREQIEAHPGLPKTTHVKKALNELRKRISAKFKI